LLGRLKSTLQFSFQFKNCFLLNPSACDHHRAKWIKNNRGSKEKCRGGFKETRTGGKASPHLVQPGARPTDERENKNPYWGNYFNNLNILRRMGYRREK
jgi:hypothetical protein